jgi:hypothetical protein
MILVPVFFVMMKARALRLGTLHGQFREAVQANPEEP